MTPPHRVVMVATSYPRFPGDTVGTFMEPIAGGLAALKFAFDEQFEDPDANRMGEGSEEGGLELLEFIGRNGGHPLHTTRAMNVPHRAVS